MKPARIEALADAIFAVAMTILVLELRVPVIAEGSASYGLAQALLELWPKFASFLVSFILIGIYWSGHHFMFAKVKRSDFNFMWLNIVFLLFICLVPFSTALLGEYSQVEVAQWVYGLNLVLCSILLFICSRYSINNHRLIEEGDASPEFRRNSRQKILMPAAIYIIGLLLSFFSARLSLMLFVIGPALYFIPVTSRLWSLIVDPLNRA